MGGGEPDAGGIKILSRGGGERGYYSEALSTEAETGGQNYGLTDVRVSQIWKMESQSGYEVCGRHETVGWSVQRLGSEDRKAYWYLILL